MFSLLRLRWVAVLITSAVPVLLGCADDDGSRAAAAQTQVRVAQASPGVEQAVDDIKKQYGDRLVRVIATVKAGTTDTVHAEQAKLVAQMKQAGALVADPIQGQPLVVIECKASELEAAVRSGLIVDLRVDSLDAPH